MLAYILLALLALFDRTLAGPTTFRKYKAGCTALIEEQPWHITNLITFQTHAGVRNRSSYISFDFKDVNKGLELTTSCNRTLPVGSNATLSDARYHHCVNQSVNFVFENGVVSLERYFEDPCIGDYPYNSAIAYGHATPLFNSTKVSAGVFSTQIEMEVPVSSMS
ncbi:Hypothetical predicted protein [Lecanosticta acicola]|uniref:Uncharacterized protein n=1 Tax=Lecanosticta acicola TaxID=111012 RepID=A0AAI8Z2W9_9PEZI|nr:Hypothetical predicted protein [Lecanosticta acicola]